MNVYFSDIFKIDPDLLEDYGALNISLINDLPLFIDPFLLFNSEKSEYQALHDEIINYLSFLRDVSETQGISKGLLKSWFQFNEVKQNWLGYSLIGNGGRGLGKDFAESINNNLNHILNNFGDEEITKGSHLEKLCLIKEGVGKDSISDFTTNLIKDFLLNYTQTFAVANLKKKQVKKVHVERVFFDYKKRVWASKKFILPYVNRDFVILTPKDILAREENWINSNDLVNEFQSIIVSVSNEELRSKLNQYFVSQLPKRRSKRRGYKKPSKTDVRKAVRSTINQFPEILDFYIAKKEKHGNKAVSLSESEVQITEDFFIYATAELINNLNETTNFYSVELVEHLSELVDSGRPTENTLEAARQRILYLKDQIENKGAHKIFYRDQIPLQRESDLQILFRLTWYASPHSVSREVNDGRGPVDYMISHGAHDKTLVEFKLAKNTRLRENLKKQTEIYEKASDATNKSFRVIMYFNEKELRRVELILKELRLDNDDSIILIDARNDNKPSGSKA